MGRQKRGGAAALVRFWLCAFCLLPFAAQAEALRDPTRPPAVLSAAQDGATEVVASGPLLQSVLVSAGRRSAIISGQNVQVGDRIGDARVVEINENEVVLRTGGGLQRLKLFPAVEKRTALRDQRPRR